MRAPSFDLDLGAPDLALDPYPLYRAIAARGPVVEVAWDGQPVLAVASHRAALAALQEPRLGRAADPLLDDGAFPPEMEAFQRYLVRSSMVSRDGAEHARLQALARAALAPLGGEEHGARVRALTGARLDALARRGEQAASGEGPAVDLVADYARPLAAEVVLDLVGVPAGERAGWGERLAAIAAEAPDSASADAAREAADRLLALAAERRARPATDVLSALVRARGGAPDADDLVGTCLTLLAAGHHTTAHAIAAGAHLLGREPAARADIPPGSSGWSVAVEEVLRCESPVQVAIYTALGPCAVGEVDVPAGSVVAILLGAANRDPAAFPDPDRFDPARAPNPHLAFGRGARLCLGAALARRTVVSALEGLYARFPALALGLDPDGAPAPPRWSAGPAFRGLASLPARLGRGR